MKTIKTITCHNVYNYGASLQAYALMKYLLNKGFTIEIIDYKPAYQNPKAFTYFDENTRAYKISKKYKFLRYLFVLKKILYYLLSNRINKTAKKKFDKFTNEHLVLTKNTYRSNEELINNKPIADIFIAGSDQIWNTKMYNGKDPAYYLNFVNDNAKKISYAASFATKQIYNNYEEFVAKSLRRFNKISVREKTGLGILERLNIKNGIQVLDPVFLLSKSQWKELIQNTYNERYLLVYDIYTSFGTESILSEVAIEIAKQNSLKIWSINAATKVDYADRTIWGGPIEFLELLNSAQCIISNSFHGTAFSVIFNKDFYTVGLPDKFDNESRITDFFDSIGLQDCYITKTSDIKNVKKIDYFNVNERLSILINNSKDYLYSTLQ